MGLKKLFDTIVALPGVDGLCVLPIQGDMHIHTMPPNINATALAEAVAPLNALLAAGEHCLPDHDDQVLLFGPQWVVLRRCAIGTLLLIGHESTNLSSVRMVSNLALRQLTPELMQELEAANQPPPATVSPELEEELAAESVGAEASKVTGPRMYRGRPY